MNQTIKITVLPIACHDCDLIHQVGPVPENGIARCSRCGAVLLHHKPRCLDRVLALTLASLMLFVLANTFPFLGFKMGALVRETRLITGIHELYVQGEWPMATVVSLTTIAVPLFQMICLLYLLIPLKMNRVPWQANKVFLWSLCLKPWGMVEVFLFGILVAYVKLAGMASVIPGIAAFSFMGLVVMLTASMAAMDEHLVWASMPLEPGPGHAHADDAPLISCHRCHLLCRGDARDRLRMKCPRCGVSLHRRKPDSISRTWALVLAALIFYIPANVLPITVVTSLGGKQADTIISGVIYFLLHGSWPIALVIFTASVCVPMLKIASLTYLLISVQLKSGWRPEDRTRLYRITEVVGRWSMIDVFVVTILVAMVNLGALASIDAGPAAVYFCAVVIITMIAAMSFDPRLIWDNCGKNHE
ncbi:MAG: paraquat-inducible protein A [Desulfobacteraceae bacterium]|nr:paraquat-inducible protein A [Desulfobacteraceae bacterium]